jgi:hypothetical protein
MWFSFSDLRRLGDDCSDEMSKSEKERLTPGDAAESLDILMGLWKFVFGCEPSDGSIVDVSFWTGRQESWP